MSTSKNISSVYASRMKNKDLRKSAISSSLNEAMLKNTPGVSTFTVSCTATIVFPSTLSESSGHRELLTQKLLDHLTRDTSLNTSLKTCPTVFVHQTVTVPSQSKEYPKMKLLLKLLLTSRKQKLALSAFVTVALFLASSFEPLRPYYPKLLQICAIVECTPPNNSESNASQFDPQEIENLLRTLEAPRASTSP